MFHLLEKLRTKSRAQRTFIAFCISLLFTGVLFVMWLITLSKPDTIEISKTTETYTPTDTLFKNISDMWESVVDSAHDAKDVVNNLDLSSTVEYTSATSTVAPIATSTP